MRIDPAKIDWRDAHELMTAAVSPRPIAFVSTVDENGIYNLAPFSFYSILCLGPVMVGFGIGPRKGGGKKDTLLNIEYAKDFVINSVTEKIAEKMNMTSGEYARGVDEFQVAGLTPLKSEFVKSPRVAESPFNLECQLDRILEFRGPTRLNHFVIGQAICVHVQDEIWTKEGVDLSKLSEVGRMGGDFYCRTRDKFEMKRPQGPFK